MNRQTKEGNMDLFYLEENKVKKQKNKRAEKKHSAPKKKQEKNQKEQRDTNKTFNFDNEIVIGVTKLPDEKKDKTPKKTKKKKQKEKENLKNNLRQEQTSKKKAKPKKTVKDQEKRNRKVKKVLKITKWTILILLIIGTIIYGMMSPIFNIKNVKIEGNEKITQQEIISLSGIELDQNMFRFSTSKAKKVIIQNPYVDSVTIKRGLPDTIKIEIVERKPTFMMEYGNGYVYLNNQGYMLEISEEKKEIPILVGMRTVGDQIKAGNRLVTEDLEKMEVILQIMETANSNEMGTKISRIDISNKQNYRIYIEQEGKVAHLGDCSNLSTRILYVKAIVEKTQGLEGEIFVDMDLNTGHPVFREKV